MSTINKINVGGVNYDIQDTNTWRPITVGNTTISDNSDSITIVGSGATSVSLDSNTNTLTISSTDNNTTYSVADNSPLSMTGTVIAISVGDGANQVAAGNHIHSGYAAVSHTHSYANITNTPTLATVATSGSYNDLLNKPTIPAAYSLPTATASVLGGVKIGDNVSINNGVISVAKASSSTFGVVKIGSGITVSNGVISVTGGGGGGGTTYTAGTGINIDDNNVISSTAGTKVDTDHGSIQTVLDFTPQIVGYTRGQGSVDLQAYRNSSDHVASGNYSVTLGLCNRATGHASTAIGNSNYASGTGSISVGDSNVAIGYGAVGAGVYNNAYGDYSVAVGNTNKSKGKYSIAIGNTNTASGSSSVVAGYRNTAGADRSFIGGGSDNVTVASAGYSFIGGGEWNTTKGKYSATISGTHNRATHDFSVACGEYCRNLFPSTAVNHLEPKKKLPEGIFGHSGKFSITVQGDHRVKLLDFTKCIFSGILNLHYVIYDTDGNVQFMEQVVYIRDNAIVKDEVIRKDMWYPLDSSTEGPHLKIANRVLYCDRGRFGANVIDMMQIGIDYTCLGEQTGGDYSDYGSY